MEPARQQPLVFFVPAVLSGFLPGEHWVQQLSCKHSNDNAEVLSHSSLACSGYVI